MPTIQITHQYHKVKRSFTVEYNSITELKRDLKPFIEKSKNREDGFVVQFHLLSKKVLIASLTFDNKGISEIQDLYNQLNIEL